ncbi:MAG: hypothetical protein JWO09_291 [Bacteroidetes bacterium]|nr:hypothetical protein [Bacteroidota bacterium]
MLKINFLVIALAAFIPMVIGAIWYSKSVFGMAWMKVSGVSEPETRSAHMWVTFLLTYVFSLFLGLALTFITIHQFGVSSTLMNEPGFMTPGSDMNNYFNDFMSKYGTNFRTFKHGALHGFMTGLFIALPVLGVNAMFEKKGFKYIAINVGFWIVCMTLMGGVICQFN